MSSVNTLCNLEPKIYLTLLSYLKDDDLTNLSEYNNKMKAIVNAYLKNKITPQPFFNQPDVVAKGVCSNRLPKEYFPLNHRNSNNFEEIYSDGILNKSGDNVSDIEKEIGKDFPRVIHITNLMVVDRSFIQDEATSTNFGPTFRKMLCIILSIGAVALIVVCLTLVFTNMKPNN